MADSPEKNKRKKSTKPKINYKILVLLVGICAFAIYLIISIYGLIKSRYIFFFAI